jgi:hypothetical protein
MAPNWECELFLLKKRGAGATQSNSEQDMKYPHRLQIILQRSDFSRVEQTGQN